MRVAVDDAVDCAFELVLECEGGFDDVVQEAANLALKIGNGKDQPVSAWH